VIGRHKDKVVGSIAEALAPLKDGMTILVGGFGLSGNPEALIKGVVERGVKDLTLVSNNAGNLGKGLATWLEAGIVSRVICSYIGGNEALHKAMGSGAVKVEMTPQGTLAERMRAAGAGIPAFYTPTGAHTAISEGGLPVLYNADGSVKKFSEKKEIRSFNGRDYVLEPAIRGDFAIVKAWKGDRYGNLVYRHTAMNFNPMMATAAAITIAEVEELVDVGQIDPDHVHTPGIFVHRIFQGERYEKRIERRTTRSA